MPRRGKTAANATSDSVTAALTFERMRRTVEQTARTLGKAVAWTGVGEETALPPEVLTHLDELLVQLIRNAVDHGIESAESRRAAGKSAQGSIRLAFIERSEGTEVTLADDGRGIDSYHVVQAAIRAGIADPERTYTRDEALNLIFVPGLSTRATPNELSGRGVGMEIVRAQVEALGASLRIETAIGIGTTFRIWIPAAAATRRSA